MRTFMEKLGVLANLVKIIKFCMQWLKCYNNIKDIYIKHSLYSEGPQARRCIVTNTF